MNMSTTMTIDSAIEQYATLLQNTLRKRDKEMNHNFNEQVELQRGSKYTKVVIVRTDLSGRSVHSFIENKTGNLLKAASWKAPAKHVRYNLVTDMARLENDIDPYGSYLYLR